MKRLILALFNCVFIYLNLSSQNASELVKHNLLITRSFDYYNGGSNIKYEADISSIFLSMSVNATLSDLKAIQCEFISEQDIEKIYKLRGNPLFIKLENCFSIESYVNCIDILRRSELFEFVNPTYLASDHFEPVSYSNSLILHSEDIQTSSLALKLNEFGFKHDDKILLPKYFYKYDLQPDKAIADLVNVYLLLSNYSPVDDYVYIDFYQKVKINSDPYFSKQWYLSNSGLLNLNDFISLNTLEDADIDGPEAWLITKGSSDVKVAVIDVGVDYDNPDLNDNLLSGFDAITTDIVGYEVDYGQCLPWDYHGTGCAGIIAAEENIFGGIGVAPYVKIVPVRVGYSLGPESADEIYSSESAFSYALIWCDSIGGVDIISCSMSRGSSSAIINAAINQNAASGRDGIGVIQIFSAGNDNTSPVNYPSILDSVISVGATTLNDRRKSPGNLSDLEPFWGSNYGLGLDLVAPGVNMLTTDVSVDDGFNSSVYIHTGYADYYGNAEECFSSINSNYNNIFNGTSASAPVVAGVCALILSLDNSLSYTEVREILEGNCDKVEGYSYSTSPSHPNGTWTYEMGYGRVNAYKALLAVQGIDYGCGDATYLDVEATFGDGSIADVYSNNLSCNYLIQPIDAVSIQLNFPEFFVEPGDTLYVYNGPSSAYPLYGKYSNDAAIPTIISTGGSLYLVFITDGDDVDYGWTATYTSATGSPGCSGLTIFNSASASFSDGSGGLNYENNSNCSWLISPTDVDEITLYFDSFSTQSGFDFVNIYDGFNEDGVLLYSASGASTPPILVATSGSMFLKFFSDDSITAMGWYAHYTSSTIFEPPVLPNAITDYEYWFDDNYMVKIFGSLGFPTINFNEMIDVSELNQGLHSFHIRFKDNNNLWSSVVTQYFVKVQPGVSENVVTSGEYWFDNDYPSKIDLMGINAETYNFSDIIDVNTLNDGLHSFHIRFKDANNLWSSVLTQFFIKTQNGVAENVINSGEYWYDNNYAGKIDVTGINVEAFNFIDNVDVNSLTNGLHSFHIRFKDANNLWSSVLTQYFVKVPQIATPNLITTYEYWFDSEPYASATSITLPTPINPYSLDDVVDVTTLTEASHTIHFRFQDINGQWSSVVTDTFSRVPFVTANFTVAPVAICAGSAVTFDNLSVNATSYLWDFGDGTTSTLMEPTHIYAGGGIYTVTLTAYNDDLIASDDFTILDAISVSELNPLVTAGGSTTFCSGESVILSCNTGFTSYQWYRNGVPIAGATNTSYTVTKTGSYTVKVYQGACFTVSTAISVTVNPKPKATVTNMDVTNDLCFDTSIKLKGSSGAGYTWQWYKDGSAIAGATSQIYFATTSGDYKVKVTAPTGCKKTSTPLPIIQTCKAEETQSDIVGLVVYPNPNDGIYTLTFTSACNTDVTISIFDAVGQLVIEDSGLVEDNSFTRTYDLTNYAKGTYTVRVVCDEGTHFVNVVVQ